MKLPQKLTLIICLFFLISNFFAQQEKGIAIEKHPKNEIRIITENFFANNNYDYLYYNNNGIYYSYDVGTNSYFNNKFRYGLGYNLNFYQFGLRTKIFYNNYNESSHDNGNAISKTKSTSFRGSIGLNYQKHLKKVVLFTGVDFGYFSVNLTYDYNTSNINNPFGTTSNQNIQYSGFSIQPLVGVKYFFSENFSISSEIRFIIDKYAGDSQYTFVDYYGSTTTFKSNYEGTSVQLGPKGSISLNVHF